MELADANKALVERGGASVEVARGQAAADHFAAVQAAGFATGERASDDWWGAYFVEQARKNITHPAQRFYLGSLDGETVTCTLVVRTPGISGVYAVATRPQHRRRGASMAVLERVRSDAIRSGFSRIILQAVVGSYAYSYYAKLGFFTRYVSQVWRK